LAGTVIVDGSLAVIGPGRTKSGTDPERAAVAGEHPSGENRDSPRPPQSQPAGVRRLFRAALVPSALGISLTQEETIDWAAKLGFEAVEPHPQYLAQLADSRLAELRAKMAELALTWSAAGLPVDFRGNEERFQQGLKQLPEFAQNLRRAGVERLGTYIRPSHSELTYLQNFQLHVRRFRAMATVLGDFGLRLGIEYVGPKTSWSAGRFPFVHTLRELRELVTEINHPAVGYTLDCWHWYTAEETREDILALPGQDVLIVHLNDAPAGIPVHQQVDSIRRLPLATGVIDLKGFLTALVEIGFSGPAFIEPFDRTLREIPREEALTRVAHAMKNCLALVD
jgi:sugar phosphate isomerase/epimerase